MQSIVYFCMSKSHGQNKLKLECSFLQTFSAKLYIIERGPCLESKCETWLTMLSRDKKAS
jgi:hypothetical protein